MFINAWQYYTFPKKQSERKKLNTFFDSQMLRKSVSINYSNAWEAIGAAVVNFLD